MAIARSAGNPRFAWRSQYQTKDWVAPILSAKCFWPPAISIARCKAECAMREQYQFISEIQPKSLCRTGNQKFGSSLGMAESMSASEKKAFGARVAQRRNELGLSQKDLAKAAGMGQQNISAIENGTTVRPGRLRELAAALNVNEAWLLGEELDPSPPPAERQATPSKAAAAFALFEQLPPPHQAWVLDAIRLALRLQGDEEKDPASRASSGKKAR